MSNSKPRRSTFNRKWIKVIKELDPDSWLTEAEKDTEAFCKVCRSSFSVANSGIASVKQHVKTNKHIRNVPVNVVTLSNFVIRQQTQPTSHSKIPAKTMEAELRWVIGYRMAHS